MPFLKETPTAKDLNEAYERIKPYIHRTPVLTSSMINHVANCSIFFKCENFQKAGAFKYRGATNAILSLNEEEAAKGVITHSSGNHAGALAKASKYHDVKATIVMPHTAPDIKKQAVKEYGADIVFCEPTIQSREETTARIIKEKGMTLVHPFNNYTIIAGQATAARELLEEIPDLDYVIVPVGGGGLASGSSLTAKLLFKGTEVIGAEPEGANDAFLSLRDNRIYPQDNPQTICDGLRTPLSEKTFGILKEHLHSIITVEDNLTLYAMKIIMERMKIIIEPSSAIVLSAILKERTFFARKNVGVILSGGNVDLNKLPF